jgi:hypothetical protein
MYKTYIQHFRPSAKEVIHVLIPGLFDDDFSTGTVI